MPAVIASVAWRWGGALAAAVLLGGCAEQAAPADASDPIDGGALPAYCSVPEFTADPTFPPEGLWTDGPRDPPGIPTGDTFIVSPQFLTGTASYSTYWMSGDAPLQIQFDFAFGTGVAAPISPWGLYFYLDHRPITVTVDGTEAWRVPVAWDAEDRRARVEVRIPAATVPVGAHTLNVLYEEVLFSETLGAAVGTVNGLFAYTVYREGYGWEPVPTSPGGTIEPAVRNLFENVRLRDSVPGGPRFLAGFVPPDASGTFRLRLGVQSVDSRLEECVDAQDRVAIVALLDGLPHPIGPTDGALVADVRWGERAVFDVDLEGMPTTGNHRLEILHFRGLRSAGATSVDRGPSQAGSDVGATRVGFTYWPAEW